jgi:hypothetical protein
VADHQQFVFDWLFVRLQQYSPCSHNWQLLGAPIAYRLIAGVQHLHNDHVDKPDKIRYKYNKSHSGKFPGRNCRLDGAPKRGISLLSCWFYRFRLALLAILLASVIFQLVPEMI